MPELGNPVLVTLVAESNTIHVCASARSPAATPTACLLTLLLPMFAYLGFLTAPARALDIPAEHHAWGRFKVGSWVRLREVVYRVEPGGGERITRDETVTTRLQAVHDDGVTLVRERAKDGDQAETSVRLGWDDLPIGLAREVRLSLGEIKIGGTTFVCQTHTITTSLAESDEAQSNGEANGDSRDKTETKWWYCPDRDPYLLKRIERTSGKHPRFVSWEIVEFGVPRQVLSRETSCSKGSLIENTPEHSTHTSVYLAEGIPGGIVFSESERRDKKEQLIDQRTKVELEAFEVVQ